MKRARGFFTGCDEKVHSSITNFPAKLLIRKRFSRSTTKFAGLRFIRYTEAVRLYIPHHARITMYVPSEVINRFFRSWHVPNLRSFWFYVPLRQHKEAFIFCTSIFIWFFFFRIQTTPVERIFNWWCECWCDLIGDTAQNVGKWSPKPTENLSYTRINTLNNFPYLLIHHIDLISFFRIYLKKI
jgi:hypothetical protein